MTTRAEALPTSADAYEGARRCIRRVRQAIADGDDHLAIVYFNLAKSWRHAARLARPIRTARKGTP